MLLSVNYKSVQISVKEQVSNTCNAPKIVAFYDLVSYFLFCTEIRRLWLFVYKFVSTENLNSSCFSISCVTCLAVASN